MYDDIITTTLDIDMQSYIRERMTVMLCVTEEQIRSLFDNYVITCQGNDKSIVDSLLHWEKEITAVCCQIIDDKRIPFDCYKMNVVCDDDSISILPILSIGIDDEALPLLVCQCRIYCVKSMTINGNMCKSQRVYCFLIRKATDYIDWVLHAYTILNEP
jgi:hypothetical protein